MDPVVADENAGQAHEMQVDEDTDKVEEVTPLSISPVDRNIIVYRAKFYVDPAVQKYYYFDQRERDVRGNPILTGSPVFEGAWNSKWQVTTTFSRWIETKRFVSLYLTRRDEETLDLWVQCEFRIVDEDRNVLKSQKSKLHPSQKGRTRGFTKFLPFELTKKMVTKDNWLLVEAHLWILTTDVDRSPPVPGIETVSEDCPRQNGSGSDPTSSQMKEFLELPNEVKIEEGDKVLIMHSIDLIGTVSRKKLQEVSKKYSNHLELFPEVKRQVTFGDPESAEREPSSQTVKHLVKFLNEGGHFLRSQTYSDLEKLFNFSVLLEAPDLAKRCITAMTLNCSVEDAAYHANFLKECWELLDPSVEQHFRRFFRNNIKAIRQTDFYKLLFDQFFTQLAFAPDFSFKKVKESD